MLPNFGALMRCSSTIELSSPTTAAAPLVNDHNNIMLSSNNNDINEDDSATCSGRGDCLNGTCLCEIRYSGNECDGFNLPYHAGISTVFYFVALISVIQLLICCVSEYQRLKQPSFFRACRLTTQKLIYFVVFLAASLRGAYFTTPESLQPGWADTLMQIYYPLLMTCSSLVVCLWAEIFHLRDIRWEKSQFLSKSFLGFLAFNLFLYSLFGAEVFSSLLLGDKHQQTYVRIFNGLYAILLLIIVIFFLIYGVEVFFKLRGGFVYDQNGKLLGPNDAIINASQLHQSRLGLLSQAMMLIVIVGFLTSETVGDYWKKKVPVYSRNWHDVAFRVFEIGVALWFPCCLWNSMEPEKLWILNPRKLLTRQIDPTVQSANVDKIVSSEEGQSFLDKICWICYDNENYDRLIQPCKCTGDVSSVHHECLRRWLVESCSTSDAVLSCKVCGYPYEIEKSEKLDWEKGFTVQHWAKTIILVTLMCVSVAVAWAIIQLIRDPMIRILTIGIAVLIGYVCVKLLSENTVVAYQKAKVSSINIVTNAEQTEKLHTISSDIVDTK